MDFRPFGDGISCVAVAMPHGGLARGQGCECARAAREVRRGQECGGEVVLACECEGEGEGEGECVDKGKAEQRVTNQQGMRGARGRAGWRAGWGRGTGGPACKVRKEGRNEAYQSRPAAERGSMCWGERRRQWWWW